MAEERSTTSIPKRLVEWIEASSGRKLATYCVGAILIAFNLFGSGVALYDRFARTPRESGTDHVPNVRMVLTDDSCRVENGDPFAVRDVTMIFREELVDVDGCDIRAGATAEHILPARSTPELVTGAPLEAPFPASNFRSEIPTCRTQCIDVETCEVRFFRSDSKGYRLRKSRFFSDPTGAPVYDRLQRVSFDGEKLSSLEPIETLPPYSRALECARAREDELQAGLDELHRVYYPTPEPLR